MVKVSKWIAKHKIFIIIVGILLLIPSCLGMAAYVAGTKEMAVGITQYVSGIQELYDGAKELSEGQCEIYF